jgi:hypothetical protein
LGEQVELGREKVGGTGSAAGGVATRATPLSKRANRRGLVVKK